MLVLWLGVRVMVGSGVRSGLETLTIWNAGVRKGWSTKCLDAQYQLNSYAYVAVSCKCYLLLLFKKYIMIIIVFPLYICVECIPVHEFAASCVINEYTLPMKLPTSHCAFVLPYCHYNLKTYICFTMHLMGHCLCSCLGSYSLLFIVSCFFSLSF